MWLAFMMTKGQKWCKIVIGLFISRQPDKLGDCNWSTVKTADD